MRVLKLKCIHSHTSLHTKEFVYIVYICNILFKNMRLKGSSGKWRSFCLGPNVSTLFIPGSKHSRYMMALQ